MTPLPKLTRPEMGRLIEIGRATAGRATFGQSPALTKRLADKGLIEAQGGYTAKTGRVVWHADAVLTDAGRAVLAGLPEGTT